MYLEGSDQHRGWFQSSLIPAMCIDGKSPFKSVLTHGHVVDGSGRKMSKSMGNVIHPQDIIKDFGADIIRLWVASSDYNEDIRISKEMLARLSEAYRKIRNTSKFILSNLYDFNPDKDMVEYEKLKIIDKWLLQKRISLLLEVVVEGYEKFEFHKAYKAIYDFCNEDLSMYYLDMVKGRLYTAKADSIERRSAQTAIYGILHLLVRLMAPILVFTSEEIWQHLPKEAKDKGLASVHLLSLPNPTEMLAEMRIEKLDDTEKLKSVFGLIPDITQILEEKRVSGLIGSSFDAKIKLLTNNQERYRFLESLKNDLLEIFKVSQVEIEKKDGLDSFSNKSSVVSDVVIEVFKAEGVKCVRCWNYSLTTGQSITHPLVCDKCEKAIGGEKVN